MIGEIVFDAGGQRWSLYLGNAAQCLIEEQYDRGFFAVLADALPSVDPAVALAVAESLASGSPVPAAIAAQAAEAMKGMRMSVLRDLAWAGLQRRHAGTTQAQVSDLIDDLGHQSFGEIIGRAIRAAQGQPEAEVGDKAAPGKPRRPTR